MTTSKNDGKTTDSSPRNHIEVERKFIIGDDCEERITDLGGTLFADEYFRDDYFDTLDYRLTLSDHWLRRRNGVWELKYPPISAGRTTTNQGNATSYCESKNTQDILEQVSKVIAGLRATTIDDLVASNSFHKIASIKSNRKSYQLEGVRIDLDTTDFGFRVGELEICVDGVQNVAAAVSKIDQLANTLGIEESLHEGKVDYYLRHFSPEHHRLLLKNGVLTSLPSAIPSR